MRTDANRKTRRLLGLLLVVLAAAGLPQALAAPLGSAQIRVLGLQVDVDTRPDVNGVQNTMTAVKDIPSGVQAFVGVPGVGSALGLEEGLVVKAELAGPAFGGGSVSLAALPNQFMALPPITAQGEYRIYNVRLEDADGNVLLRRDPTRPPVVVDVLDKLLVSQVTSRPLSLEEIREKGIVIDEDNFTALNFTVGLTLGSEQVVIDLPVVFPSGQNTALDLKPPQLPTLPEVQSQLDRVNIPNLSLAGFSLRPPPELEEKGIELAPINGVVVIPGNIGFLNQFFSVLLQATNVAPNGSGLIVENAQASIRLPSGEDEILGSGDDPLRVAETQSGGVQEELPLVDANGGDAIPPQGTNTAEFLVEGLREGTHRVDFDLRGDLYVPALGEYVELTGEAVGVVQVRNPTFSIVLAHPDVIREGEAYSVFATVTNTSSSPANLFQLRLNSRSLSGARLADGETDTRTLESLAPGDAETFEFRLVARTTGEVRSTVFLADEGVNGSFVLTTGVGDTGVPLSPDTLVLPDTVDYLPAEPDLVFAAVRVLGQAYSVATAPAGALPPDIARVGRSFVFDRAVTLAQAGLHARFGDSDARAAQTVLMDYLGADAARLEELYPDDEAARTTAQRNLEAFDNLRRRADAGHDLSDVLGEILGSALAQVPLADFQLFWAEDFASRPPHLSFGASSQGPPLLLRVTDPEGRVLGRLRGSDPVSREIPFADLLPLGDAGSGEAGLAVVSAPVTGGYLLEFAVPETTQTGLSLIVPEGDGMVQAVYGARPLPPGTVGRLDLAGGGYAFALDTDGDGVFEEQWIPDSVLPVDDPAPSVVGVHQWGKGAKPELTPTFSYGDPIGRMVGILFSEEVTPETAERRLAYSVPENRVSDVSLQPDGRLAFAFLDKPVGPFVPRSLTASGVNDLRGNALAGAEPSPIQPDPERGVAGRFTGQVVTADGRPVPYASVKYIQPLSFKDFFGGCLGDLDVRDFIVSTYEADGAGRFAIDYVLQSGFPTPDCPSNPDIWLNESNPRGTVNFKLEATDPETGEVGKASTLVAYDGQRLDFKVVIRGYGAIEGRLLDEDGNLVPGGDPGTPGSLAVIARNVSTGEVYASWVDGAGSYAFPRTYVAPDGSRTEASKVTVGNLILQVLRVSDGHTAVSTVNLPAAGVTVTHDLVLVPPNRFGTVTGRVLEADGVAGAANVPVQIEGRILSSVSLYSRQFTDGVVGAAVTDDQGFFRFENVPTGDVHVRAVRQSTYEQADARSVLVEGETLDLALVFPGTGGTVQGIVRDALGNAVPGAVVAGGPTLTETDTGGFFEIVGLPLGSFTIFAQAPDSRATGKVRVDNLTPGETQQVVITLEPVGSILGTVYRGDGVTPVPAQKVQLWLGNKGVMAETYTDANGNYRFQSFPVAEYSVRAVTADYGNGGMANTAIRFAGDVRDADVVFRGLGRITGRVIQSDGTPAVTDVVIVRKVWRIVTEGDDRPSNYYLDYVRQLQGALDEDTAAQIQKVLDETGASAPSAQFFMLTDEPVLISSDRLGPNSEVTGEFLFEGPATGGPFQVAAFGPFLTPAQKNGEIPRNDVPGGQLVDVGDIVLEPATGEVMGTVYLPDGVTPVGENVRVKIRSLDNSGSVRVIGVGSVSQPVLPEYDVVTDANGRFHFPLVLNGRFVLTADSGVPDPALRADTAAEMETERFLDDAGDPALNVRLYGQTGGVVPKGEVVEADIRLLDAAGVDVRVVANDGTTPVPYAEVTLTTASTLDAAEQAGFQRLIADDEGFIDFFPIIEGGFSVSVRDPGSSATGRASGTVPENPPNGFVVPVTVTLGAVTTSSGQVVQAAIFGTVEGTVYKADGSVLENPAQVTVTAKGASMLATTDDTGWFQVENVPGGAFSVEAFEPFTARRGTAGGSISVDGQVVDVAVTLVGLGTVNGTVYSNDGSRTFRAADVVLYPSGRFSDRLVSRTDGDGFYSLPGVPLGAYTVKVNDTETGLAGEASDTMRADGDTNTTDVYMQASGRIGGVLYAAGTLLDPAGLPIDADGQPLLDPPVVSSAQVVIKRGRTVIEEVQTGIDGSFSSSPYLTLGDYTVTAVPVGGGDGVTASVSLTYDGEEVDVPLVLAGQGTVEGQVLDSLGIDPVATAQVTLRSASPFSNGAVTRFTDADGRFRFDAVPVGDVSLSIVTTLQEPPLGATATGALAEHGETLAFLDGDEDAEHDSIRLQQAANIAGRVLLSDAVTPAEGAIVTLQGGGIRLSRVADATGVFTFEALPLAAYSVSVTEPVTNGVAGRTATLSVNGETLDLGDLVLDADPPRVTATVPAADATDVSPTNPVVVTFSEPVNPATVTADTFRVTVGGQAVAGARQVATDGLSVTFIPSTRFPDLARVRVEIRADRRGFEGQVLAVGVRDLAGLSLPSDVVLELTTGDATAPSLISVSPPDGAQDVALASVIRLELSEPVDPASIAGFSLTANGTPVDGALNATPILGGRVLVFTPAAPLQPNRRYVATLSGPLRDLAGNAMSQAQITTAFDSLDTLAPVVSALNVPEPSALVSGRTVSLVVDLAATDDLARVEFFLNGALVASDAQAPYAYDLYLDPAFGASATVSAVAVDGSGNRSDPVEASLVITANQAPQVSLVSPTGGTASQGQLLSVRVAATDDVGLSKVTFAVSGAAAGGEERSVSGTQVQETFGFRVPSDLQVGSVLNITASAVDSLGERVTTAAVAVTVEDLLPPTVTIGSPANNSEVEPGSTIEVFVRGDDSSGIASFSLEALGATTFSETRAVDPVTSPAAATFGLSIPADASPAVPVTLVARATDGAGNTGQRAIGVRVRDRLAPTVSLSPPTAGVQAEPGSSVLIPVAATDEKGVSSVTVSTDGGFTITVNAGGQTAFLSDVPVPVPESFAPGQILTVTAVARDAAGNEGAAVPLQLAAADLSAPTVIILAPEEGAEVIPGETVTVTVAAEDRFALGSLELTVTGAAPGTETRILGGGPASAEETFEVPVPADAEPYAAIVVSVLAIDAAGNASVPAQRTLTAADVVPPEVTAVQPANGAEGVPRDTSVVLTFSEPMDPQSLTASSVFLTGSGGETVAADFAISADGLRATLTPAESLVGQTSYTVSVTTGATDVAGNALAAPFASVFTTEQGDVTGPRLLELLPADGADQVGISPVVRARFDELVAEDSVNADSFSVTAEDGTPLSADIALREGGLVVDLVPRAPLTFGSTYRVTITSGITDLAGNAAVDADGNAFDTLSHDFRVGGFALVRPVAGDRFIEGQILTLEAAVSPPARGDALLYAPMDGNADDSAGARVATVTGTEAYAPGAEGEALVLDGTTAVSYPSALEESLDAFTATLWLRSSDGSRAGTTWSYAVPGNFNEITLFDHRDLDVTVDGTTVATGISLNDGAWHHLAVAWRSVDGALRVYVDGELAWAGAVASGGMVDGGGILILGQEQDSLGGGFASGEAFAGELDAVALYDRFLDAEEVRRLAGPAVAFVADGEDVGVRPLAPFRFDLPVPSVGELASAPELPLLAELRAVSNVVRAGTLSASSVYPGSAVERAADGDAGGTYSQGSVWHSNSELHPWWQADLGGVRDIERIALHLRTDCCQSRNGLAVLVADTPFVDSDFAAAALPDAYQNGAVEVYRTTASYDTGSIQIPVGLSGRYVRVVHLATDFMHLAEVQVFAAGEDQPTDVVTVTVLARADDEDEDGMLNGYELDQGTDPYRPDAGEDPDEDDLTNAQELDAGTDPFNPDSDGDGVPDGADPKPTVFNLPPVPGTSSLGHALVFDGVDDYAEANVDLSPHAEKGTMTVSAWVKVLAVGTDPASGAGTQTRAPVLAKGTGGQYEYALYVFDDLRAGFDLWQCSGSGHGGVTGGRLEIGRWHHLSGTYEQTGETRLYLDGKLVAATGNRSGSPCNGSRPIRLGSREDGQFLNALIDEVRIWDVAREGDDIRRDMDARLTGAEPGLAAYWRLDEGAGSLAADAGPSGTDAIFGAAPAAPGWSSAEIALYTAKLSANTTPETPVAVDLPGFDPNADGFQPVITVLPDHGALFQVEAGGGAGDAILQAGTEVTNPAGQVLYLPDTGYAGLDTFAYKLDDGQDDSREAQVGIGVLGDDTDGDGLTDSDEFFIHGTDPANADSDGDGLDDGVEVNGLGTDPTRTDTDGDGVGDAEDRNPLQGFALLGAEDGRRVFEGTRLSLSVGVGPALEVASVRYELNEDTIGPLPPPFATTVTAPPAAETSVLAIQAVALDASGAEIARDGVTLSVVPPLTASPRLMGVPLNGQSVWRLAVSTPLAEDLPIALTARDVQLETDEGIQTVAAVGVPAALVTLPAGETVLDVPLVGLAEAAALVTAESDLGTVGVTVSVSGPVSERDPVLGAEMTATGAVTGVSVTPEAVAIPIVVGADGVPGVRTIKVPVLVEAAGEAVAVTVTSSDETVVSVATDGVVPAGSRTLELTLTLHSAGRADVLVRYGDRAVRLPIFAGIDPGRADDGVASQPVGMSIAPAPAYGDGLVAPAGAERDLLFPLVGEPAAADTSVIVSSSDPSVAAAGDMVIPAGSTTAALTLTTGVPGTARLRLEYGSRSLVIPIEVGDGPGYATGIASEPVGVAVQPAGTAGTLYVDPNGEVSVQLPLFGVPVTDDVTVTAQSREPWVADVTAATLTVPAGGTAVELGIVAGAGSGSTLIELDWGTGRAALRAVVGIPPEGEAPLVFGRPVGVEIQ